MSERLRPIDPKLTVSSARGYDKDGVLSMSEESRHESGVATLEGPSEQPHAAQRDRSHAWAEGAPPETLSEALRQVKSLGSQKMRIPSESPVAGVPEKIGKIMGERRPFQEVEKALEMVGHNSAKEYWKEKPAIPGETIRKGNEHGQQTSWREFEWPGWSKEQVQTVATRLQEVMGIQDEQVQNCLELLVAGGKDAQSVIESFGSPEMQRAILQLQNPENHRPELSKLGILKQLGIKRDDYIMKFVLQEEFEGNLGHEFNSPPKDIETLAWQMTYENVKAQHTYGVNGKFPLLEMRIKYKEDGKTVDTEQSRYYVNEANMVRWLRQRMLDCHYKDQDQAHNFFDEVFIEKSLGKLSLGQMVFGEQIFTSEDGHLKYGELAKEFQMLPLSVYSLRDLDVKLKQVLGNEEEQVKILQQLFYSNILTKELFGKSMLYYIMTIPLEFKSAKEGELPLSDSLIGIASNEMRQAYYNLADLPELRKVLGKNSSFFKKDGWLRAMQKVMYDRQVESGQKTSAGLFPASVLELFNKAFDEKGEIKKAHKDEKGKKHADGEAFLEFINFVGPKIPNAAQQKMVRYALQDAAKEKYFEGMDYPVDEGALHVAEIIAFSWLRWSGMDARLDVKANCYSFMSKLQNMRQNRYKQNTDRGGSAGNMRSFDQYKSLVVSPTEAWQTNAEDYIRDKNGQIVFDSTGKPRVYQKSAHDVEEQAQRLASEQALHLRAMEQQIQGEQDPQKKNEKQRQLAALRKVYAEKYNELAAQMEFKEKTMSAYSDDHYSRMVNFWGTLMKAKETDFSKFTQYDMIRGVTFEKAAFQEAVQDSIIKPLRYALKTYGELNYDKVVRGKRFDPETNNVTFEDMPLGEAMFGYALLNRKQYWKVGEDGNWAYENGRHVIDYTRVQEDKTQLWKQAVLMKFASDLAAHRDLHSNDPVYNFTYYKQVIEALSSIPDKLTGDETDIMSVKEKGKLFTKDDMKWFKHVAKVENYDLYTREFWTALFMPKGDKKQSVLGSFAKAAFHWS